MTEATPTLASLISALPDYARDLKVNLGVLSEETGLNDTQKWGSFLASALAVGVAPVVDALEAECRARLTPEALTAVKAATAITSMNTVYFRALHLLHNKEYEGLKSGLRMSILRQPGADRIDFELWSLAVSAINGCGLCLDSHEKALRSHGVGPEPVQTVLRIAAVVHAVSAVLRSEEGLMASRH